MKEAYVSFEVAKLLKEKGFDWVVNTYYCDDCDYAQHDIIEYNKENYNSHKIHISAPTQQMACRWLREEHNILVCILPCEIGAGVMDYTYCIYRVHGDDYYFEPLAQGRIEEAMDYEKTLEAGLEYVLKNLI